MRNTLKSKVCVISNALIKQGMSRSKAFVRAWITVKLHNIKTKTACVTYGNRQKLINHLTRYAPEDISIALQRERDNAYDMNAVQVVASVKGKGSAVIGCLGRGLAATVAPLMDKGKGIAAKFCEVTGGGYGYNYGLNFEISL